MEEQDIARFQKNKILREIRDIVQNIDKIDNQVNMYDELIKQDFLISQNLIANGLINTT